MQKKYKELGREEQAKLEIGHTEISRRLAFVLLFAFLLTIYSVPLIQQIVDRRKVETLKTMQSPTGDDFSGSITPAGMISVNGLLSINASLLERINLYQDHLEESMFLTKALNPAVQSLMTGWLKGGNEQAYCGTEEWLFYRPDVDYLTGRGFLDPKVLEERGKAGGEWTTPPQPDPLKALILFRDQLAQRDIQLLVVPVPSKTMIYPDKYSSRFDGRLEPMQNASFDEFLQRLHEEKIASFDPAPLLIKARGDNAHLLYHKTDTHWTPLGMSLVADALAERIEAMNILDDSLPVRYRRAKAELNNLGDIAAMLKLPETQDFYHPETVTIEKIMMPDGSPWRSDPDAEILFLGDSFANIYSLGGMGWGENAGFVETLSKELGRPIDSIIINDNGSYATRRILSRNLRKGQDRLDGKRLVVYEFAVRELSKGDWKTDLDLTLSSNKYQHNKIEFPGDTPDVIATGDKFEVRGKIADITQVPSPGTVPYKDCILAIHLVEMSSNGSQWGAGEALIYAWGMHDNQLTEHAQLRAGQQVITNLVQWSDVESRLGSYNRQEIDNENIFFMDSFWWLSDLDDHSIMGSEENMLMEASHEKDNDIGNLNKTENTKPLKNDSQLNEYQTVLSRIHEELNDSDKNVWQGRDGWLFFGPELRSLTVGQFWGERAASVSKAMNPQYADPLEAIVDFNEQLKKEDIELWVVPVPQKSAIYPAMIDEQLAHLNIDPSIRYDGQQKTFYNLLATQGVQIVDLYPIFTRAATEGEILYCRQDTHWAGKGMELTSRELTRKIKNMPWYDAVPKKQYQSLKQDITISGDLWKSLGDDSKEKESLNLTFISENEPSNQSGAEWRESPVLLLGDSHNLVFHVGQELFAKGAGFPDLIAYDLGFAVDLVAVRGSGATPARINLLRRKDNLKDKRLVIWCFTAREFTETTDGWRKVPVIR